MNNEAIDALSKLLHVQAQGTENADDPKNLADYVWMLSHQIAAPSTNEVWSELRPVFEELNKLLNPDTDLLVGRSLLYAVNGLMSLCLNSAAVPGCDKQVREQMLQLAWRICVAWDAVLAGDIENIGGHVELESAARGI